MIDPRICFSALLLAAVSGCGGDGQGSEPEPLNSVANIVEALPAPEPMLDRAGLIGAVALAVNSYAAGVAAPTEVTALAGRQFSVRIPFGCADDKGKAMTLTPRRDGTSYEVRVRPAIALEQLGDVTGEDVESAEGFWLERPWLLDGQCPAVAVAPASDVVDVGDVKPGTAKSDDETTEPPPPDRSIGIVQLFTASDSRVGQRSGRDYVKVEKLKEGEVPPPGLALVLEGRLQNWPGGTPVRCTGNAKIARPNCLVLASVDRVEIRRQDNDAVIAEWHR